MYADRLISTVQKDQVPRLLFNRASIRPQKRPMRAFVQVKLYVLLDTTVQTVSEAHVQPVDMETAPNYRLRFVQQYVQRDTTVPKEQLMDEIIHVEV